MQDALNDQIRMAQDVAVVEMTRIKLAETLVENKAMIMSIQEIINDYENNYKAELQIR